MSIISLQNSLDSLPISLVFLITVLLMLLFNEVGFRVGKASRVRQSKEASQVGTIVGATLALLAFMLAFSFGMASARFDARKQGVINEVNAISTTWLRSQILPEPHPEQLKPLFIRYVNMRFKALQARSSPELNDAVIESTTLQTKMWTHAVDLARSQPRSEIVSLFISALNEMIDTQELRLAIFRARIPLSVWITLYLIAFAAFMVVGIQAGSTDVRNVFVIILLAMPLSGVMTLIIDLDRVNQSLFNISQQSLVDLQDAINTSSY